MISQGYHTSNWKPVTTLPSSNVISVAIYKVSLHTKKEDKLMMNI